MGSCPSKSDDSNYNKDDNKSKSRNNRNEKQSKNDQVVATGDATAIGEEPAQEVAPDNKPTVVKSNSENCQIVAYAPAHEEDPVSLILAPWLL